MPNLQLKGSLNSAQIELNQGRNTFGSGAQNDFQIEHESVSEIHCELIVGESKVVVRDLGSTNGTLIDYEPIEEAVIRPGQLLQLGTVEMIFEPSLAGPASRSADLEPDLPAPPSLFESGGAPCHHHPDARATLICERCHQELCERCSSSRAVGKTILKFCLVCGGMCVPIESKEGLKSRMAESFPMLLRGAFGYPFKRDGLILLFGGTLFFAVTGLLSTFSFVISAFAFGYLCAYLQKIIQSSAHGDEQMPGWPDVSDFGPQVLQPALQYMGTLIFCLGPGIAWLIFAPAGSRPYGYLFLALGVLYVPMALLAVSMYDSLAALNPLLIVTSILRAPSAYAGACMALAVATGAGLAMDAFSDVIQIPVLTAIVFGFVGLYFQVVAMRILGLFYYTQQGRLGLF